MFDVVLNGDHTVVTDLDIFEKVGRGVAHDEYIPFKVNKGKLIYNNEESDILGGKIRVEFIKVMTLFFFSFCYFKLIELKLLVFRGIEIIPKLML